MSGYSWHCCIALWYGIVRWKKNIASFNKCYQDGLILARYLSSGYYDGSSESVKMVNWICSETISNVMKVDEERMWQMDEDIMR